jgi:ribosomal protein L7/L12
MFAFVLDVSDFIIIWCIVAVSVSAISVYLKPRERARLARVEAKLDLLLKHAGLAYDPRAGVPPGVEDALQRGKKIEAMQLYSKATGLSLQEAKDYVDELQASPKT